MNRVLVLGASGGMGYSIVKELANRNFEVVAFARDKEKLEGMFHADPHVIVYPGDAFKPDELAGAAHDVDIIFHAVNLPYGDWAKNLHEMTRNIITTAKKQDAKLAVVDNIYAYGRNPGGKLNENASKNPHTKKGKIRLEMERLIKDSGVSYVIAHFPDFYGPNVENGQLNYMISQIVADKKASFIGNQSVAREHIFTPDGAKAIVELALHDEAYGQNWNIPAHDMITGEEIIKIMRHLHGYDKSVSTVTKNMLRIVGVFNKQMREFVEMQYLNKDPVALDGTKYEHTFGPIPSTPYEEGLRKTIASYCD